MIRSMHAMFYSSHATELRAFLRDKLGLDGTDVGGGWLIFRTGASELGVHPTGEPGSDVRTDIHHEISLVCDEIESTVADLKGKGVEFTQDVRDDGFGLTAMLKVPGAGEMLIYEPRHPTAHDLPAT